MQMGGREYLFCADGRHDKFLCGRRRRVEGDRRIPRLFERCLLLPFLFIICRAPLHLPVQYLAPHSRPGRRSCRRDPLRPPIALPSLGPGLSPGRVVIVGGTFIAVTYSNMLPKIYSFLSFFELCLLHPPRKCAFARSRQGKTRGVRKVVQ